MPRRSRNPHRQDDRRPEPQALPSVRMQDGLVSARYHILHRTSRILPPTPPRSPIAMTQREVYIALLRPCVMHILRAAGFHAARPAALDSLVDLAARHLELLAAKTAEYAYLNHNGSMPATTDVRMAMQYVGLLKPELGGMEEQLYGDDDMRGVDALVSWFEGPAAREIRRVAGLEQETVLAATATAAAPPAAAGTKGTTTNVDVNVQLDGEVPKKEDYLTVLKKKHSKTGDEARFQGTMLGKDLDARPIMIEGGYLPSIAAWEAKMMGLVETVPEEGGMMSE